MEPSATATTSQQFKTLLIKLMTDHAGLLLKGIPLAVGFLIFFTYFCQTKFFPSIDLYSLILLLISAFIIGSAVMTAITLGYFFPGWSWVDSAFRRDNGMWASYSSHTGETEVAAAKFMLLWLARPLLLNSFCTALIWSTLDRLWLIISSSLVLQVIIVFFFGELISRKPGMSLKLSLDYIGSTFATLSFTTIICLISSVALQSTYGDFDGHLSIPVALSAWAIGSVVILANAAASRCSFAAAFSISIALSLLAICGMRGPEVLPSKFVSVLGVGHYQADQIILEKETCSALSKTLKADQCIIPKAWVIWAIGDMYKLRALKTDSVASKAELGCKSQSENCTDLVLPKAAVMAIVRSSPNISTKIVRPVPE